jgi:hypothetical protein
MKNLINLITSLVFLLTAVNIAVAGDNVSIPVSCIIPAIPGINVPMLDKQLAKNEKITENNQGQAQKNKNETDLNNAPIFIAQDDYRNRTGLTEENALNVTVKTIYSR